MEQTEGMGAAENPNTGGGDQSLNPFYLRNAEQVGPIRIEQVQDLGESEDLIAVRSALAVPGYNQLDTFVCRRFPTPGKQHISVPTIGICDLVLVVQSL